MTEPRHTLDEWERIDTLELAVSAIEEAQTPIEELAALHALDMLVGRLLRECAVAALRTHRAGEVGRALGGVSKQAVSKRFGGQAGIARRPARTAGPNPATRKAQQ